MKLSCRSIFALLAITAAALGQDTAWKRNYDAAKQAFAEKRYADADKAYKAALSEAENFEPGDPRLAQTLFGLGIVYSAEGRTAEAEPLLQRVVELREAEGPSPDLVKALQELAEFYRTRRHFEKAWPLYQKALDVSKTLPNADPVTTASLYLDLGLFYSNQDQLPEAETAYLQAIAAFQTSTGTDRTGLGFSNMNLAQIYEAQNKLSDAEPLYQHAIAAFEDASGPNGSNVATALDNYARLLKKTGRKAEASKMQKRADAIRHKSAR